MTAVSNSAAAAMSDIRDIKPPVPISSAWEWLWWAAAALVVLALLFFLWRWQRRQRVPPVLPRVPAHVRAKQKLAEALALISQPKPFCILVSDTARFYLEERFNFHAPERTTEEFLRELGGTELLSPDQKESLGRFLESCDLVKFAKYEPGENELHELHSAALRLVEETEPTKAASVPAPGAAVDATSLAKTNGGAPSAAHETPVLPGEIANRKS